MTTLDYAVEDEEEEYSRSLFPSEEEEEYNRSVFPSDEGYISCFHVCC
jgi:hypothetical protein